MTARDTIIRWLCGPNGNNKQAVRRSEDDADGVLAALNAAGFYVIHRDDLMAFLKAIEAANQATPRE